MMKAIELTASNVDLLIEFEKKARVSEPEIFISAFDETNFYRRTLDALNNPLYASAHCLMCVDDVLGAMGRLDYAILPSFSFGGNLRVYVDWVYILKEHRRRGVAQFLFASMENRLKTMGIDEYFLVMAENSEAQRFYRNFPGAQIERHELLTKNIITTNAEGVDQ